MAQLLSPGVQQQPDVVTVAELLSRNAPVPVTIPGTEQPAAVPVGNLLRREGHDPEADPQERSGPRHLVVRGAAIVAGTALVAGSAFGGAVLVQTFLGEPEPLPAPAPEATPATDAGTGALVDRAAATNGLDAGTGAPTSWAQVAFPTTAVGTVKTAPRAPAPAAAPVQDAPRTSTPAAKQPAQDESAQGQPAQDQPGQATSPSTASTGSKAGSATTSSAPATSSNGSGGGLVGSVVNGLGGLLGLNH